MKKTLLIVSAIIAIMIMIFILTRDVFSAKEPTATEICYGTGYGFETQVASCGLVIKEAQMFYSEKEGQIGFLKSKQRDFATTASGARTKINEIAKEFYSKNLTGTNVSFF